MNLTTQKRLAAEILDVGVNKIWVDPARTEDVSRAITRDDIRHFISNGAIAAEPEKGNSRGRFKKAMAQKAKADVKATAEGPETKEPAHQKRINGLTKCGRYVQNYAK